MTLRSALRKAPLLALVPALVLAACGGEDPVPTIETTTFAASLGVNLAASTLQTNGVYYRDITVGTGATVAAGAHLYVHYTGWLPNGGAFDSNQAPATPFDFYYGQDNVITAWNHGFTGMKVGGTRQLVIPPSAGYGSQAAGAIPPYSILVFNVTVVDLK